MLNRVVFRKAARVLPAALALAWLPGCGESVPTEPGKPIGITNPSPDNALKDVNLENESGNMKLLKEKTKAGAPSKSAGPNLPGQPGS